ncbi:MAG: hypothetical protein IKS89_02105, partial [Spirochaetales bacterium]|nr:hypothetical protein [Spirochaetales bacterium]
MNRKKDIPSLLINGLFFYRLLMAFVAKYIIARLTILADIGTFMYGLPYDEYGLLPMLYQKFGLMMFLKKDVLGVAIISSIHFLCRFEILTFCVCSAIGYIGIRKFLIAARSD